MRTSERWLVDVLPAEQSSRPLLVPAPTSDDAPFRVIIGLLVGAAVCLPIWAAIVLAIVRLLR